MFRRSRTLLKTLSSHTGEVNKIKPLQIIRNNSKQAGAMSDKFRLPTRYGAGEKSVW